METNKDSPMLETSLEYSLGVPLEGKGRCRIYKEYIQLLPEFGAPFLFSYRDIRKVTHGNYRMLLILSSGEELVLSKLGYHYEPCISMITRNRAEMLIQDMLAHERLHRKGIEAGYTSYNSQGEVESQGTCELRFYETALIFITSAGELHRIFYCFIDSVRVVDYSLHIDSQYLGKYIFTRMGKELDPVKKLLSELLAQRSLDTQNYLKEKFPNLNPLVIRKAASLLKDGLAVNINELEEISPTLKKELENFLPGNIKEQYDFLSDSCQTSKVCLGIKRSLMGELSGDYIWFLAPIYDTDPNRLGNVVAMEAANIGETEGRATYLFRMTSWEAYRSCQDIQDLHRKAEEFIACFNRCMMAINFRREPIYITKEMMEQPRYVKYRVAIENMPELQFLRQHFIGRVFHKSLEQWKKDLTTMISQGE